MTFLWVYTLEKLKEESELVPVGATDALADEVYNTASYLWRSFKLEIFQIKDLSNILNVLELENQSRK